MKNIENSLSYGQKIFKTQIFTLPLFRVGHVTGPWGSKSTKFALKITQKNFGNTAKNQTNQSSHFPSCAILQTGGWVHPKMLLTVNG